MTTDERLAVIEDKLNKIFALLTVIVPREGSRQYVMMLAQRSDEILQAALSQPPTFKKPR